MENDELAEWIAKLEAQLAELKAQLPKAEKPFVQREPIPRFDPTEGMRLPADAAQAMARVVPDPPKGKGFNPHAWSQTKISEPGWLPKGGRAQPNTPRRAEAQPPVKDHRSPQTRIFDAMVDAMVGGPNDTSKLR